MCCALSIQGLHHHPTPGLTGMVQCRIIFMRWTLSTIHLLVALQIEAGQLSIIVSSRDRLRNVYFPERARPSGPGVAVDSR
jgi:hypothetical protein